MESKIPAELRNAYLSTRFRVFDPPIEIRIGQVNPPLNKLLKENEASIWAYITAFNPFSKELTVSQNLERHEQLRSQIENYAIYEGEGAGDDATWIPERSFLVLGISKEDAKKLGMKYEQNAIVAGEIDQPAELLLLV